jgi:hypothetical protein
VRHYNGSSKNKVIKRFNEMEIIRLDGVDHFLYLDQHSSYVGSTFL